MAHYMMYMSAVILMVCGLTFLLSACTEEMVDGIQKPNNGPKIAVKFSFGGVNNKGNEVLTRNGAASFNPSFGGGLSSPYVGIGGGFSGKTIITPVTDDIFMFTTLEEDQEVKTRTATSNLDPGTKIRVVAYLNGTTYNAHADYTVSSSHELTGDLLEVDPGNYKFVAYSFNSSTLPDHIYSIDMILEIYPMDDLLWGYFPASGTYPVNVASYEDVPITMSHMFSQVKIQATTVNSPDYIPPINSISGVSLSPGKIVHMSPVRDALFTDAGDFPQLFSSWSGTGTPTVTSETRLVNTNGSAKTYVNINSLTLDGGFSFSDLTAEFDKQLKPGISYTLNISFKKGEGVITVSPEFVQLSYVAHTPASQFLTVTSRKGGNPDPSATWTLTSYDPWLTLSLNSDGTNASPTVYGMGDQKVYLVATLNTGPVRVAQIYLNETNPVVTVMQELSANALIHVEPAYVEVSYLGQTPVQEIILTLTSTIGGNPNPTAKWKLSTTESWLWLSLNENGSGSGRSIEGTGSKTIYLVTGTNNSVASRTSGIYLNDIPANIVSTVLQKGTFGIGEQGNSFERIYIDDNGGNPKLMLTQNPNTPGAFFQFGGIRGWKHQASGAVGNASYNPSQLGNGWNSGWSPVGYSAGYVVTHTVASLRAGTGDPCRLVGLTQSEIQAALNNNNVPDNKTWRLPIAGQLEGFAGNSTTFPRHGFINPYTNTYQNSGSTGYYWSSYQTVGSTTYTNVGYLQVNGTGSAKIINSLQTPYGMNIRCVSQR